MTLKHILLCLIKFERIICGSKKHTETYSSTSNTQYSLAPLAKKQICKIFMITSSRKSDMLNVSLLNQAPFYGLIAT